MNTEEEILFGDCDCGRKLKECSYSGMTLCNMCEECGKNMTEENTRYDNDREEDVVIVCVDCFGEEEVADIVEEDICGETGRDCDIRNPKKGCGKKTDETIMIGNISFCLDCADLDKFVKWGSHFEDRNNCYFCGGLNDGDWEKNEDGVCCGCGEKWEYDENKDGYIKKSIVEEEEMKSIDWVKRNEKMIDFTMTQKEWEAQHVEPESDTDTEEDLCPCCGTDCDNCHLATDCSCPDKMSDWWGAGDGVVTLKYATQEYMEMNFDEYGGFIELVDNRLEDIARCGVEEEE